jgi:hypothetical protein
MDAPTGWSLVNPRLDLSSLAIWPYGILVLRLAAVDAPAESGDIPAQGLIKLIEYSYQ